MIEAIAYGVVWLNMIGLAVMMTVWFMSEVS